MLEILIFLTVWATIWLPIAAIITKLIDWQPNKPLNVQQKLILLASLYLLAPLVLLIELRRQNIPFVELGLSWQSSLFSSLIEGLIISVVTGVLVFSLESCLGFLTWNWHNWKNLLSALLSTFALGLLVSAIEELIFRGYLINQLTIDFPYLIAAILSSLIFATLHLIWERKETIPQLPGLWLMGMILVAARIVDRGSLGLAWGLHTGWIWFLSVIDSAQLISYNETDRPWISGINQQPLAGVAGIACLLLTGIVLWSLSAFSL